MTLLPPLSPNALSPAAYADLNPSVTNVSANFSLVENILQDELPMPAAQSRNALGKVWKNQEKERNLLLVFYKTLTKAIEERREIGAELAKTIGLQSQISKKISEDYLEAWKQSTDVDKLSGTLQKISKGAALLFLASLAAGFVTGGTSGILSALAGGSSAALGASKMGQAYTHAKKQDIDAQALGLKHHREKELEFTKDCSLDLEKSSEAIEQYVSLMEQTLSKSRETARTLMR